MEEEKMTIEERDQFAFSELVTRNGVEWVVESTLEEIYNRQWKEPYREAYWRRMSHLLRTVKQLANVA